MIKRRDFVVFRQSCFEWTVTSCQLDAMLFSTVGKELVKVGS